jgi:hypothetical protein
MPNLPFCKCGCGERVKKKGNKFAGPGHNTRIKNPMDNKETKEKHFKAMDILFQDPSFLRKREEAVRSPENRKLQSELTSKRWEDPEYRKNTTKKIKEACNTDEYKEKTSKEVKERYKDPEYARRLKEAKTIGNRKKGARKKKSIATKELYKDPEYRKKHLKWLQEGTKNIDWDKRNEAMTGDTNPSKRPEVKKKLRLKAIERIESNLEQGHQLVPYYNPAACVLIDEYGKQHGYNFKHAENGGEFHIKELGYWVDGYDKKRNTVIEVDEPAHFDCDGNLSAKDVRRQTEITDFLNCNFIRLKI